MSLKTAFILRRGDSSLAIIVNLSSGLSFLLYRFHKKGIWERNNKGNQMLHIMTSDLSHLYLDMKGRVMELPVVEAEEHIYLHTWPNGTIGFIGGKSAALVMELSWKFNFT